ncbi:GtrA family protein [Baekduia soli]|uniref:GtrA family protein n=1 Tax=Baekduia soli TaxID=496014 RepID=UPI0016521249|nr:GtrA family protein [Baekduia soli]
MRFCAVGVLNTMLTLAAFEALTHVGLPAAPASALGFALGAVNGYLINRRWTFRSTRHGTATLLRYVAVQAFGAALSAAGVALASSDLAVRHLAAEAVVLPIVTLVTYTLARRLVFGVPPAARAA